MSKLKICIDAGHGGTDPGAVLGTRYEKDDNLKIAMRLGKVLKANGVDVFYTRTTDIYDSPSTKAKKGNNSKADYFVSIHRNAAAAKTANGTEVLVYNATGKKNDIAKSICKRFESRGFVNRGVKLRTDLTVLKSTTMPAILIELGFIASEKDNKLLDEKFNTLVNDIARGIFEVEGLKFKTLTQLAEK